jgi:hypothetical protein
MLLVDVPLAVAEEALVSAEFALTYTGMQRRLHTPAHDRCKSSEQQHGAALPIDACTIPFENVVDRWWSMECAACMRAICNWQHVFMCDGTQASVRSLGEQGGGGAESLGCGVTEYNPEM